MAERTQTNTQIRNFYSDGYSYLNTRFFNTNLSFSFSPFLNKDANGRPNYDTSKSISTSVNFEGAFALYDMAQKLIANPSMTASVQVPCNGATLTLERRNANPSEVFFSINKNNENIQFKFASYPVNNANGVSVVEAGLGAFMKTVEGYLTGINADRHLDKLTEDYAKLKEGQSGQQGGPQRGNFPQNNYQRNNWNGGNNNYRKNNGGGNFQRRNNNWNNNNNQNRNNNQQSWETKPNTQNISTYQIQD